jgi:hypothetical protein
VELLVDLVLLGIVLLAASVAYAMHAAKAKKSNEPPPRDRWF